MRLRSILVLTAMAATVVFGGMSANAHYLQGCSHVPLVTGTANAALYIDDRPSVWVYAETNLHTGYQSGGLSIILEDGDEDTCYNHPCTGGAWGNATLKTCPSAQTKLASDTLIV